VAFALDADAAGEEAMQRGVGYENVLDAEVRVIILPAGSLGKSLISQFNLPPLIRDWLLRLVHDFNSIVMIYGGALLLVGIALIVTCYALRRARQVKSS